MKLIKQTVNDFIAEGSGQYLYDEDLDVLTCVMDHEWQGIQNGGNLNTFERNFKKNDKSIILREANTITNRLYNVQNLYPTIESIFSTTTSANFLKPMQEGVLYRKDGVNFYTKTSLKAKVIIPSTLNDLEVSRAQVAANNQRVLFLSNQAPNWLESLDSGASWSPKVTTYNETENIHAAGFFNNKFWLILETKILNSDDGDTWQVVFNSDAPILSAIVSRNSLFFIHQDSRTGSGLFTLDDTLNRVFLIDVGLGEVLQNLQFVNDEVCARTSRNIYCFDENTQTHFSFRRDGIKNFLYDSQTFFIQWGETLSIVPSLILEETNFPDTKTLPDGSPSLHIGDNFLLHYLLTAEELEEL